MNKQQTFKNRILLSEDRQAILNHLREFKGYTHSLPISRELGLTIHYVKENLRILHRAGLVELEDHNALTKMYKII